MKQTLLNIIFAILLVVLLIISIIFLNKNTNTANRNVIKIDTIYNRIILDSIEYNIKRKDTVIYKIKLKVEEDVKEIINSNDSVALATFNRLVTM